MKNKEQPKPSSEISVEKKEKGENVHLKISLYRHAEKTPEGELSELGLLHAKQIGKEKAIPRNGIKAHVSPFRRTKDTVDQVIKGIEEQALERKIYKTRIRAELAPPMWKEFKKLKKNIIPIEKKEGHDGLVRYILSAPEAKEDLEKWTNALAYLVENYTKMSHRLYNNSDIELMHVAHEPLLSSFLKSIVILRDKEDNKLNVENIDQIGGPFQPGEYLDFDINSDKSGQEHVKIVLRGKTYEVDMDKLREMAQEGKCESYKGRTIKQDYTK